MSKKKLFEDDDESDGNECNEFIINEHYARYYHQGDPNCPESDTSSDDEIEIPTQLEKDFFKTLASLKKNDPVIYNKEHVFFPNIYKPVVRKKLNTSTKPDLEENLIKACEDNQEYALVNTRPSSPTQKEKEILAKGQLKEQFLKDDEGEDNLFTFKQKSDADTMAENTEYRNWLKGKSEHIKDEENLQHLESLKNYWQNPDLDNTEKFLRDYILEKKFCDIDNDKPYQDENDDEDDNILEKQEKFEVAYNTRFENIPSQTHIKNYPRVSETSVRAKKNTRKIRRDLAFQRKAEDKYQKMENVKERQAEKRKEIAEKMKMLREITGNRELAFEDLGAVSDEDFDPEKHDKKMNALFNHDYYNLEDDVRREDWNESEENAYGPHCEDPDFNMDCDYMPKKESSSTKKSRRDKGNRLKNVHQQLTEKDEPMVDPDDPNIPDEDRDAYYAMECEDFIGYMPCRFKYKQCTPNNYGLTIDELLRADEKELNRWYSFRKMIQIKEHNVEMSEKERFERRAQNEALKQKILPSLYMTSESELTNFSENCDEGVDIAEDEKTLQNNGGNFVESGTNRKDKKKRKYKKIYEQKCEETILTDDTTMQDNITVIDSTTMLKDKNKKNKKSKQNIKGVQKVEAVQISPVNIIDKKKRKNDLEEPNSTGNESSNKTKRKTAQANNINENNVSENSLVASNKSASKKKNKYKCLKKHRKNDFKVPVSNSRLESFGINPNKFERFVKYGNK